MTELFLLQDISLIIITATVVAAISSKLRQPLLLGYVLAGVLIGPVFDLVTDQRPIEILSELGIGFLLFIIGLELDFRRLREVGFKSSLIGLIQVVVTSVSGFLVAIALGFSTIQAAYIGMVISFSSTMIVAKLLGEQRELDSLHGELVLVILIIQDILAVVALSLIEAGGELTLGTAPSILLKGFFLILFSYLLYKALPFLLKEAIHSTELIFITALTTMFLFSALASYFEYSFSIGAFIAGVALSTTRYSHEITGRVKPLKDFFLVLFFVTLGMRMVFKQFQDMLIPIIALIIAVMVLKPVLIFLIAKQFGYGNRSSFFTGVQLAQVGEFSLVLAAVGVELSHINEAMFSMLIALTITTMLLTAYVIKYDDAMYNRLFSSLLKRIWKDSEKSHNLKEGMRNHTVIFGFHKMSQKIIPALRKMRKQFILVDHNPEKIKSLSESGISCICSDMTNPEVFEQANLKEASAIISTVHNFQANTALIRKIKGERSKAIVMVASNDEEEAIRLYEAGADFVIIPLTLGGEKVINYLKHLKPEDIKAWGKKYYDELKAIKYIS
ncbi:cation:proton antiporter [Candidatus Woesearchaeota archaeon]|nr:cation:proton antiporter [Candidatus Woesearchaeota archaeon]